MTHNTTRSDSTAISTSTTAGGGGLRSLSFQGLLFTQLLTATNDNIFRWLAIGIGKDYVTPSNVGLILMAGTACFVLPYLLLAAPAGYLGDRFSKRTVIVCCKLAEIFIMALGIVAIAVKSSPAVNLTCLFTVVALAGAESALFSPAKMGIIPELLRPEKISAANGLFGLATVAATVIGMAVGSWLKLVSGAYGQERWWVSAIVLLGIAGVGLLFSLFIRHVPAANPERRFPWDAPQQTWRDLRLLAANRALLRVALGVVFFWSVGALAQLNVDQFAFEGGAFEETDKVPLLIALVLGVGIGSVLAGIWSGGRVELGILPLGAFGVAVASMLLFTGSGAVAEPDTGITFGFIWVMGLLYVLGVSAGLFSVPLEAYMQHRSPPQERGSILAAMNFLVFLGVLLVAFLFAGLRRPTYPGSLENIAPLQALQSTVPRGPQDELETLYSRFQAAWDAVPHATDASSAGRLSSATPPNLNTYLSAVPEELRVVATARLLWIELTARRARGEFFTKEEYLRQFTDVEERRMVRDVYAQAADLPLFSARQIFLLAGLFTIPVFLYIVFLIPQASARFVVWLASRTVCRIRVQGQENLPEQGGAVGGQSCVVA